MVDGPFANIEEFKTSLQPCVNERSRRAALRMGFTFEGIQESHMIVKGKNRLYLGFVF